MPVRVLLEQIDAHELTEWMAYAKLESEEWEKKELRNQSIQNVRNPRWVR